MTEIKFDEDNTGLKRRLSISNSIRELNKFRITQITALATDSEGVYCYVKPINEGLNVEYRYGNEELYIVVSTIIPKYDDGPYLEWVRDSVLEFNEEELKDWQTITKQAMKILEDIIKEEN